MNDRQPRTRADQIRDVMGTAGREYRITVTGTRKRGSRPVRLRTFLWDNMSQRWSLDTQYLNDRHLGKDDPAGVDKVVAYPSTRCAVPARALVWGFRGGVRPSSTAVGRLYREVHLNMAIERAVLLIADIGGYTHYMQWNRMHLAHAQLTVAALLESVIDAGKGLKLAKLEGDAAFFWAPDGNAKVLVCDRLSRMRQSFLARQERIKKDSACDCASCAQLDNLSLKFVAHEGEVAEQRVKRHVELAGVDVILVHRMLKNQVPVLEYVLMTDPVAACLDESMRQLCKPLTHDFEGIGQTSTHYIDLATSEVPPAVREPSTSGRLGAKLKLELSTLPFVLGIKEACAGFRNLGRGTIEVPPG